jgi:hypothetical protein
VTPSAWNALSRVLQVGGNGYVSIENYNSINLIFGSNYYRDSGNDLRYLINAASATYTQSSGIHAWYTAPSGTAGNAISFTQAMTLDASGNLLVGTTSSVANRRLYINGGHILNVTNNDHLYGNSNETADTAIWEVRANQTKNGNIGFVEAGVAERWSVGIKGGDASLIFGSGSANINLATARARITSGGDVQVSSGGSFQVGGTAARATTAGTNRVDIFDGTAPVGTLANGVSFYSASGEANVMDAAGNATLLSPHDSETNEWIFRSKHTPTGKVLRIDVERLLRFVNEHFGLDAVKEFVEL